MLLAAAGWWFLVSSLLLRRGICGERSGWRNGISHALFKVCSAYIPDREKEKKKVLRYVCCGTHTKFLMPEAQQIT